MVVYEGWVSDDRPCDPDGPVESGKLFQQRDQAVKWLADWVRDDIEQHLDGDDGHYDQCLALYEAGQYEQLLTLYPTLFPDPQCPLRLGIVVRTVD
jgi:hypothetical protein